MHTYSLLSMVLLLDIIVQSTQAAHYARLLIRELTRYQRLCVPFLLGLSPFWLLYVTVLAENIVVTVGHNTTNNASAVFQPQSVTAKLNDIVVFNFTEGNHTVTQSLFYAPCIPANGANNTVNGFDSGFRDTVNGTAITILTVPITTDIENQTLWFFDYNTCGEGGVGVINVNESSSETLEGFERNAVRLNGTASSSTSSSMSRTSTSTSASSTGDSGSNDAQRTVAFVGAAMIPVILLSVFL
ncbi:uncharacterized protein EV420DRAFT_1747504 [Desarmillaria tabescens]|uniref:Uncharacterized protein n=1 Tax=Armillaria tabescens TaxID=1929756 RepID=A0AA39KDR5_ARMTA|nr:uncharacterized protein EV420DRAFT_1747504 [Desarmillaria tabescens]KAK0459117.1 hypothetical protein EV420DRAFT_1747504 [Desarmillaria tabescens]